MPEAPPPQHKPERFSSYFRPWPCSAKHSWQVPLLLEHSLLLDVVLCSFCFHLLWGFLLCQNLPCYAISLLPWQTHLHFLVVICILTESCSLRSQISLFLILFFCLILRILLRQLFKRVGSSCCVVFATSHVSQSWSHTVFTICVEKSWSDSSLYAFSCLYFIKTQEFCPGLGYPRLNIPLSLCFFFFKTTKTPGRDPVVLQTGSTSNEMWAIPPGIQCAGQASNISFVPK